MSAAAPAPHVVILAAAARPGLDPELPPALAPAFFRPLLLRVLDALAAVPRRSLTVVADRGDSEIREAARAHAGLRVVRRARRGGPADEVRAAAGTLDRDGDVLIADAGSALISRASIAGLLARHADRRAACTVACAAPADPRGFARLIAEGDAVFDVRAEARCAEHQLDAREVEAGLYCFRAADLLDALERLEGRAGEDGRLGALVADLAARGREAVKYRVADPDEALRAEDAWGLARVEAVLRARHHRELLLRGVALRDPVTTLVDPRCRIEPGVVVEGGVTLLNSTVEAGALIESHCRIVDSEVGRGTRVRQGTLIERSSVGRACVVGPYANLRPGSHLEDDVRVGDFVEVKNASIGEGTRAAHLSYIGDAEIGKRCNIGCGFVTCNYDGSPEKKRTIVEDDVFVGSDTQAIAPVRLGARSFIATGSSITDDVPPDSFAISRGRQLTKVGYAKKYMKTKPAPQAAEPRDKAS